VAIAYLRLDRKFRGIGTAFNIETFRQADDFGPSGRVWSEFEAVEDYAGESDGSTWRFTWQTRNERVEFLLQEEMTPTNMREVLADPDVDAYLKRAVPNYREYMGIDEDVADGDVKDRLVADILMRLVSPAADEYMGFIYAPDDDLRALKSLPLPKWARVLDQRKRGGKLRLVVEPRRTMEQLKNLLCKKEDLASKPKAFAQKPTKAARPMSAAERRARRRR
jgi:hypothetical protein